MSAPSNVLFFHVSLRDEKCLQRQMFFPFMFHPHPDSGKKANERFLLFHVSSPPEVARWV
jgi:hypothetical protein